MRYSFLASIIAIAAVSATTIPEAGPYAGASAVLLHPRQIPTTGGPCDSDCTPVQTKVTGCGADTTCLCTTAIAQALQACAKCGVTQAPSSATMLQDSLTQYASGCQQVGKPVGTLNVGNAGPASNAGTGASTPVASASGTLAGVPTGTAAANPVSGAGSGSAAAPGAKASVLGMGLVAGVAAAFVGLF